MTHPILVVLPMVGLLAASGPAPARADGAPAVPAVAEASPAAPPATRPETRKAPVVDRYHGVEVVDDYRWLESWDDPAVRAWSDAQNAYTRSLLDRLPGVEALRRQVTAIRKIEVPRYSRLTPAGGKLLALLIQPPRQQPVLVALASADAPASARTVVDPTAIDPSGATSIDWFVPSPDGALVAVSLSSGGSERGDVHLYETATGRATGEVVQDVNGGTAGGDVAWDGDGRGFFYTRYPRAGERPAADLDFYVQVYHHRLGTPETADRYELGRELPRIAEIRLTRSPDGRFLLVNVQNGDSGEFEQHLRTSDGRWLRLTRFADRVVHALFGPGDSLLLLSRAGAPRGKLLRASLADAVQRGGLDVTSGAGGAGGAGATVVIPEGDGVIEYDFWILRDPVTVTENRLFVLEGVGGIHRVRIFDLSGQPLGELPLPPVSAVFQVIPDGGPVPDAVLYQTTSYTEPATWYRWAPGAERAATPPLSAPYPVDWSDVEVVREQAVSKDGTRVPLNILRRKGIRLDGSHPTLLTGYGGYGVGLTPRFDPLWRIWLDHGGVIAVANLRGGGEFGEEWHRAGNLTRKQNVFDDFLATAEHLVRAGYTRQGRLAILGGSNGGLLMGAMLTQRPELFQAVVSYVGLYDMLRSELDPNGAFNIPEFGTVKDPEQFRALHAYSPYHRVRDGVAYPPILFLTGANDPRVNPMQSRKMTARLQAAGAPALLRTSATSGHGLGTPLDARIEEEVDVLAFLFDRLGVPVRTAATGGAATGQPERPGQP